MSADDHLSVLALPRDLRPGMEIRRVHEWVTVTDVIKRTRPTSGGYHRKGSVTRYAVHYRRPNGFEDSFYAAPNHRIETCAYHKPPEEAER